MRQKGFINITFESPQSQIFQLKAAESVSVAPVSAAVAYCKGQGRIKPEVVASSACTRPET
jgi:hypothetical protein